MMKSKWLHISVATLVLVIIGCQVFDDGLEKTIRTTEQNSRTKNQLVQTEVGLQTFIEETQADLEIDQTVPAEERNTQAYLQRTTDLMTALYYGDLLLEDVVRVLEETGLDPYVVEQNGIDTTVSVRTRRNWPGTRYLEINYISDEHSERENPEMRLHNFRFEYQPGENSMEEVMTALDQSVVDLGIPSMEQLGYHEWDLENDYRIAIRRLSAQEIEIGHIHRAYKPEDVGTLSVTLYKPVHFH